MYKIINTENNNLVEGTREYKSYYYALSKYGEIILDELEKTEGYRNNLDYLLKQATKKYILIES